jgi:hypothetical protein
MPSIIAQEQLQIRAWNYFRIPRRHEAARRGRCESDQFQPKRQHPVEYLDVKPRLVIAYRKW